MKFLKCKLNFNAKVQRSKAGCKIHNFVKSSKCYFLKKDKEENLKVFRFKTRN